MHHISCKKPAHRDCPHRNNKALYKEDQFSAAQRPKKVQEIIEEFGSFFTIFYRIIYHTPHKSCSHATIGY